MLIFRLWSFHISKNSGSGQYQLAIRADELKNFSF